MGFPSQLSLPDIREQETALGIFYQFFVFWNDHQNRSRVKTDSTVIGLVKSCFPFVSMLHSLFGRVRKWKTLSIANTASIIIRYPKPFLSAGTFTVCSTLRTMTFAAKEITTRRETSTDKSQSQLNYEARSPPAMAGFFSICGTQLA